MQLYSDDSLFHVGSFSTSIWGFDLISDELKCGKGPARRLMLGVL